MGSQCDVGEMMKERETHRERRGECERGENDYEIETAHLILCEQTKCQLTPLSFNIL